MPPSSLPWPRQVHPLSLVLSPKLAPNIYLQELFVQHLTTEAQTMTKLERKPRRNIQYKDMGGLLLLSLFCNAF